MTRDFARWCGAELKAIAGSDDLTLAQFCMTLDDKEQIREYLIAYLGESPKVSAFANEFLRRKDGGEWSTQTGGRKKKSGR